MKVGATSWHRYCPECGYERGALDPKINVVDAYALIDERQREAGLTKLRQKNFARILSALIRLKDEKQEVRLLEVGPAHGWFLEMLLASWHCLGIEPDLRFYEMASSKRLSVRLGYFPEALDPSERFDVITF